MRKFTSLFMALAVAAAPAFAAGNAPVKELTGSSFRFIPAGYTKDNAAILYQSVYSTTDNFVIYNNDFETVKTFAPVAETYKSETKTYTNLKGINIQYSGQSDSGIEGEGMTLEQATGMLQERGFHLVVADGKNLFYPNVSETDESENNYNYTQYDRYGAKYPNHCYYLTAEGQLFNYYRIYYKEIAEISNEWILLNTEESTDVEYETCSFEIVRPATAGLDNEGCYLTQTLFNDDEAFEYMVYIESPVTDEYINDLGMYETATGDYVTEQQKTVSTYYRPCGVKVMNESGRELMSATVPEGYCLEDEEVFDFGAKKYLVLAAYSDDENNEENIYKNFVYAIEPGASGKLSMAYETVAATVRPNVAKASTPVTVLFGTEGSSTRTVIVTAADGRVAMSRKVDAGVLSTSIDTSSFAPGMYIVTVAENGRKTENCKIIIR